MKIYNYEKLDSDFRIDFYSGTGFPQDHRILHSHPYHEFSLICEGDITYTSNTCVDHTTGHCFIFSAAHQLHNPYIKQDKKYERYQIMFSEDFISSFLSESHTLFLPLMSKSLICRVSEKSYLRMLSIMETLLERHEKDPLSDNAALESRLLVSELLLLATDIVSKESDTKPSQPKTYIDNVVDYIQKNYAENIKLSELASSFFVSYTKLSNDFNEQIGMTVGSFITLTRIEAAKIFLLQGYSVSSVAALVGYPGTSYFIKLFKRYARMTPLKFQQNMCSQK